VVAALAVVMVVGAACSSAGAGPSATTASAGSAAHLTTDTAPDDAPAVPSAGCARTPVGPVSNQKVTLDVDGTPRWYLIDTPSPATPGPAGVPPPATGPIPRPLLVNFHGLDEGAVIQSTMTMFGPLGQKDGFVSVFPNGRGSPVAWQITAPGQPNPDLAFVTAMVDQVESTQCIDTSRVYATGLSNGSFMTSLVACSMADRFAAVAAVSGLLSPTNCHPARRIPVLAFHGTADPILYFNGGVGTAALNRAFGKGGPSGSAAPAAPTPVNLHGKGYPANVQAWAVRNGCDPASTDTRVSSQVILRTYRCPAGTGVEFYIILGGGHAWPGSTFSRAIDSITGFTTFQINASDAIWQFFRRYRL
jgi:polyhydroxybutyrate depolymerase